ncbi:hypothetical protein [Streptomyces sp. NPDC046976]|uniref:hypothetical protein n=1 Tax=Streptomyces sp. NPDC046976 TaxID=3155258 RepID=UPI00340A751E
MTRYRFAIKALPQGSKPFGQQDDEDEDLPDPQDASLDVPVHDASNGEFSGGTLLHDPVATQSAPVQDPTTPPATDAPLEASGTGQDPGAASGQPADDSRPWAGDMYDEGDETSPDNAYAAYTGSNGEQAWLDQAQDGTLTGWVRDSTGQVWRYTDPDAWALDVDGAQMTRTHGPDDRGTAAPMAGDAPSQDRGVQDSMFAGQ